MDYKTASKIHDTFKLDKDFNISYKKAVMTDPMCKGYIYANLYFYDEVLKEIEKLRLMVEKIHNEVILELGLSPDDPLKLFFEISTRAHRAIGDDGLDSIIKEFLAQKSRHIALMVDDNERVKYNQICSAVFMELTNAFYTMTLQSATDLERGVKMFRFTREYIEAMNARQKTLVAPALRVIGLEHSVNLKGLEISQDFTVKYLPELIPGTFVKQEDTLKDQIKTFIQKNA